MAFGGAVVKYHAAVNRIIVIRRQGLRRPVGIVSRRIGISTAMSVADMLVAVILVELQAVAEIMAEFVAYRFGDVFFMVLGRVAQIIVGIDIAQIGGD